MRRRLLRRGPVPRPSAAVKAAADQFAANVLPVIREIGVERRNQARRDYSDWDVVAFHPAVSKRPEDLFKANQIGPHPLGGEIELVIAHPEHWNDPRQYMSDLRTYGIKLR
jgi:hypothetical protein